MCSKEKGKMEQLDLGDAKQDLSNCAKVAECKPNPAREKTEDHGNIKQPQGLKLMEKRRIEASPLIFVKKIGSLGDPSWPLKLVQK